MKVECEMSLDEWCQKLHSSHLVNTELAALRAENAALNLELQKRDKCAYMGPMRDCPTHGESTELKALKEDNRKLDTLFGEEFNRNNDLVKRLNAAQRRIKQLREALDSTTKYLPHFSTELQQITTLLTTADNTDEIDALLKELEEYRQRNIDVCIENSLR